MELKENATFLGFVGVSDQDGMFVGVGDAVGVGL